MEYDKVVLIMRGSREFLNYSFGSQHQEAKSDASQFEMEKIEAYRGNSTIAIILVAIPHAQETLY